MPRAERAGVATAWRRFGQGPRRGLAIHCSLAHSGSWAGLARELADVMTITAFDLPGHGQSADWQGHGEIQAVSTAVAAAFLDGPADILGHSFGATVALRLGVERPDLVRSLILYEPVFFAVAFADDSRMRALHATTMAGYAAGIAAGDMLRAAEAFTAIWGDGRAWAMMPEAARRKMAAQMPLIAAADPALCEDAGGMLASGALGRIAAPVLVMEGARSPAIIAAVNAGLAARLPHLRRAVIAGAGHMGPITHPGRVAAEVRGFLGFS